MTDPISDMLARIKNACMRGYETVSVPASKLKLGVLDVLLREGYISGYVKEQTSDLPNISITLKYHNGRPVIDRLMKVSKPGCRVYSGAKKLPMVDSGLGISIISTSYGILSDAEAREKKAGGEVICKVF